MAMRIQRRRVVEIDDLLWRRDQVSLWEGMTHDGTVRDGTWERLGRWAGFDPREDDMPLFVHWRHDGSALVEERCGRGLDLGAEVPLPDGVDPRWLPTQNLEDPWILTERLRANAISWLPRR
ncbi:hypothetical protein [Pseudokineococcus sp. 1T1Z-3]|uniref:hypothetical protein n=1 Tax=Pseudokineococcus sp. 1T1Z-3 TaxID=3132745 RepID=UPI0030A547D0